MTKQHLYTLIDELIELEPSLQGKETQLMHILETLADIDDAIVIDEEYIQLLRNDVLRRLRQSARTRHSFFSLFSFMNVKHPITAATLATFALVAVGAVSYVTYDHWYRTPAAELAMRDTALPAEAFGPLTAIGQESTQVNSNSALLSSSRSVEGFGGGVTADGDAKMMILPMYTFRYTYEGNPIVLPTSSLPVYRRAVDMQSNRTLVERIADIDNPFLQVHGDDVRLETISLKSISGDYHYYFDFFNGRANINAVYTSYQERTEPGVQLSDEENIAIARQFLQQRGISLDRYGEPVVDNRWKQYSQNNEWIPPTIGVVFPERAGDTVVHERDGGMPMGLTVSVVQQTKQAESAWNILAGAKESSAYPLVADVDRLVTLAENGGSMYRWYGPENTEEITYTLGTPDVIYIQYYLPAQEGKDGEQEVYVPALRFPVTGGDQTPEYYTPPMAITIPLVEELVVELERQPEDPPMQILQSEPAVEGDSAVSSEAIKPMIKTRE